MYIYYVILFDYVIWFGVKKWRNEEIKKWVVYVVWFGVSGINGCMVRYWFLFKFYIRLLIGILWIVLVFCND